MATEIKSGEEVEVLEDEGPEEGEIEDDTSDEDNVKNLGIGSSNVSQVKASMGTKYFQAPSSSKEVRKKKPQTHAEEKSEKCWGNMNRRRYKFYVDHDNPSREPYDRLKKSDVNSDRRGVNFHELLSEYKTSKHDNEGKPIFSGINKSGNTHEKENRHYSKEVRSDSTRKRESLVNDVLTDKAKKSRKRKHRHSPSHSPVSSEPDGRRKKEIRTTRPRRRKKPNVTTRNSKESALIFAQIRASKLNSQPTEQKEPSVELINVVSEGEYQAEGGTLPEDDGKTIYSEGESNQLGKSRSSEAVLREGEVTNLPKEPSSCVSGKGSFTASDSQTAEKIEDSESKDEDDDDVLQLRMIALQSAFRAKYLARKRLGLNKKNPIRAKSSVERSSVDSILDDTEELLEAAEDLTSSPAKEHESDNAFTSLEEVPLPPDEPLNPSASGITQAEDLTPVDMELALTDEEDVSLETEKDNDCDFVFPNDEGLHPIVRITRSSVKAKTIPVNIGRKQHQKVRQRSSIGKQEICRRKNLLEVVTAGKDVDLANLDSSYIGMEDVGMYSMEIHDPAGTQYSADYFHQMDEDRALSEASDAKSDSVSAYTGHIPSLSNDNDDEDEELLRAKLLLDISKRHRKEEAVIKTALTVADIEEKTKPAVQVTPAYLVKSDQTESTMVNSPIKVNGDSSIVRAIAISHEKMKTKRVVERVRKGNALLKAQALKSAHAKQYPITTLVKGRVSKMSNRGKYQRINQSRTSISKKKLDGNIQVTVTGSNSKSKVVSQVPKQQDRIVICLGEDSDDSEDDIDKKNMDVLPQMDTTSFIVSEVISETAETGFGNQWEIAYHQMMDPEPFMHMVYPESGGDVKVEQLRSADSTKVARIPIDFEKSVDLFLKEVRSVQESKSKNKQPTSGTRMTKAEVQMTHPAVAKPKVAVNTPQAVKPNLKSVTGITPQAVRHLPFPQQEEYRRLKMQISILEMQKKRKAGEISQAPPKSDQKGVPVKSLPLSKSNQTSTISVMEESKNNACEPNNPLGLNSELASKDKEAQEKSSGKVSEESTKEVSDGVFDDNIEDENVMREQLLRSRLRKRAAAKAESSPALRESESILTLSTESNVEAGDLSNPKSAVQLSSSVVTMESGVPAEMVKPVLTVDSEKEVTSSKKVETSSAVEPVMLESKVSEACDATSITEETPHTGSIAMQVVHVNTSLNDKQEDEEKIAEKREVISAKEDAVKNVSLEAKETTEKRQVTNVKVDVIKKVSEGNVLSGMRVNGREMATAKELPSHSIARGFSGATKRVNLQSGIPSTHHRVDSKESQLKELESKLLSERHAALDYLRELQQLLNAMEFEGNRLREKEAAVKKLRTELSLAEVSLLTQKRLMKQLAMNVSSVRARVTETRHKCTLLSRACHKLGNQIKQEEIASGGEKSTYRVPTGVAELVKSQLSSVLFHKKQLKKSGLPFLDPSQELTSKDGYSVKKSGKKFVRVHQQPNSLMWARSQLASNRSNLKVERNSPFSPSKFVKFVQSSSSLVKSGAASKSTADLESVASTSTSAISTLPVAKGLMTSAKLSSTKESPNPPVAVLSANQTATKGVHVPDSNTSVVVAGPSSVTEDGASSVSRTNVSSFILMPSDSIKKIDAEKSNPLREYESPLISISRTASEKLNTEISSHSENIHPEESMNLDPNVMLCPYDLRGVCQDEECTYQHQRRKGAAKKS